MTFADDGKSNSFEDFPLSRYESVAAIELAASCRSILVHSRVYTLVKWADGFQSALQNAFVIFVGRFSRALDSSSERHRLEHCTMLNLAYHRLRDV